MLAYSFCENCNKFNGKTQYPKCTAFLKPWPLWNTTPNCPARETDYVPSTREIEQCWREEVMKKIKGGGEKQDRTHKLFGRDRMKDNRWKEPWSGFLE